MLFCIITLASLASYHSSDPSFSSYSQKWSSPQNSLGYFGSWLSDALFQCLGWSAWLLPAFFLLQSVRKLFSPATVNKNIITAKDLFSLVCLLGSVTLALNLSFNSHEGLSYPVEGLLGLSTAYLFLPLLGKLGCHILSLFLLWVFFFVWWQQLPQRLMQAISALSLWFVTKTKILGLMLVGKFQKTPAKKVKINFQNQEDKEDLAFTKEELKDSDDSPSFLPNIKRVFQQKSPTEISGKEESRPKPENWELPPLSLLKITETFKGGPSQKELLEISTKIVGALDSFDIKGEITEISPGPIITMYEFQPASGVRVQKIVGASVDLALTLGVPSVRIVAPIPGKSVVGIEVPNIDKEDVLLGDVYSATIEKGHKMTLPISIGKDAEGGDVCADLARMPHLLIGGATSMGKSVFVNSILSSLLFRFSPDELKLIIVDPKLVEFKVFEDIPHLLVPIVNDPEDANQALKWAVAETKRRYNLLQKIGAKNLESYNQKVKEEEILDEDENPLEALPYIVIIIDELAELMLSAKKQVEQSIVRLTQLARAAGVHLIMATQRPSADVVTGLIKSNCPARAALRVASSMDSRIILDCTGAEQLLGKGDLFFTNAGPMAIQRVQGCFVSDEEIETIVEFWKEQADPDYLDDVLNPEATQAILGDNSDCDKLYGDVLNFARSKGKISTSLIQRRFQVGYTRAARIMEQLEARGIVSEQSSAGKARDVIA